MDMSLAGLGSVDRRVGGPENEIINRMLDAGVDRRVGGPEMIVILLLLNFIVDRRVGGPERNSSPSLRIPTKSPGYNGMMSPGIPE